LAFFFFGISVKLVYMLFHGYFIINYPPSNGKNHFNVSKFFNAFFSKKAAYYA